ncbi:MAG: hypothetical protein Kow0032_14660 [Methyloligellaceae bacterium]
MTRFLHCAVVAALLLPVPAHALTVTNEDTVDHVLTIIVNGAESTLALRPGQRGNGICEDGCVIRMQNGDEYEFEGRENVVIDGEQLFLEEIAQGDGSAPDQGSPRNQ